MGNTNNNLQEAETKGKYKNISIVARINKDDSWIVDKLDEIAKSQNRSRTYVALKLLAKILPKFKGEIL